MLTVLSDTFVEIESPPRSIDDDFLSSTSPIALRTGHLKYEEWLDRLASSPRRYPFAAELSRKLRSCREYRIRAELGHLSARRRRAFLATEEFWRFGRFCDLPECLFCRDRVQRKEAGRAKLLNHPLVWVGDLNHEIRDLFAPSPASRVHLSFLTIDLIVVPLSIARRAVAALGRRLRGELRSLFGPMEHVAIELGHLEVSEVGEVKPEAAWNASIERYPGMKPDEPAAMIHAHLPVLTEGPPEAVRALVAERYPGPARVNLRGRREYQPLQESIDAIIRYPIKHKWDHQQAMEIIAAHAELCLALRGDGLRGVRISIYPKRFGNHLSERWIQIRDDLWTMIHDINEDWLFSSMPRATLIDYQKWKSASTFHEGQKQVSSVRSHISDHFHRWVSRLPLCRFQSSCDPLFSSSDDLISADQSLHGTTLLYNWARQESAETLGPDPHLVHRTTWSATIRRWDQHRNRGPPIFGLWDGDTPRMEPEMRPPNLPPAIGRDTIPRNPRRKRCSPQA